MRYLPLFIVLLLSFPVYAGDCIRCLSSPGSVLMCRGALKSDVVAKCGKPESKEAAGFAKVRKVFKRPSGKEGWTVVKEPLERWRYNCGNGQFGKVLLFQGDKLKSVNNLRERGSGAQRCW